jgi:glycerol-1-phosphate dehydrogenase [NAD(P)+]
LGVNILEFQDYLNNKIDCCCGKKHKTMVKKIILSHGAIDDLANIFEANSLPDDIFIVSDSNTYKAAAKKVVEVLREAKYKVKELVFNAEKFSHPDEKAVGTMLFNMEPMPKIIVAVGSGSITDLCRFCASKTGIPYIVIATAPSMDGYVSTVIPITKEAMKISIIGKSPEILIADLDILEKSPKNLLASGFGDMVGKITAKLDWMLASKLTGEVICDKIEAITDIGVENCFKSIGIDEDSHKTSVKSIMYGLLLSGIAMQLNNNSRPASGSEHHISHFLEMLDILGEGNETYHGERVGVASLIIMRFYEKLFLSDIQTEEDRVTEKEYTKYLYSVCPKTADELLKNVGNIYIEDDEWENMKVNLTQNWDLFKKEVQKLDELRKKTIEKLEDLEGFTNIKMLGYEKQKVRDAVFFARTVRTRFTILTLLDYMGLLGKFTDEVLEEIYK